MTDSIWVETGLLSVIRVGYFIACRHYVNVSLFSNLRSVIREDGGASAALESPGDDGGAVELDEAGSGYFNTAAPNALPLPATSTAPRKNGKGEGSNPATRRARLYARLSSGLFCLSFSESCTLFTLLLFGEAVSER